MKLFSGFLNGHVCEESMSYKIKAIETVYNGYRFRSRLEAKWAVFFDAVGIRYQYEIEGYEMDDIRYLPDFYLPDYDRWFEIKGKTMSIAEIKKCEEFCFRKDNENIKFSILLGYPEIAKVEELGIMGIMEYTWEWPSELYPENYRIAVDGLVEKEYYSRFVRGIWRVPNVSDKGLIAAVKKSRGARFEHGETPEIMN